MYNSSHRDVYLDDLISIAYIGLYICLKLTLPWINKLSVNYLKLKSYENLQLYVNKETKMILDYINKLYHDNLLFLFFIFLYPIKVGHIRRFYFKNN